MRKVILLLLALVAVFAPAAAQHHDVNESMESEDDYEYNRVRNSDWGCTVNGVFTKRLIGIDQHLLVDMDSTAAPWRYPHMVRGIGSRNDSLMVTENPQKTDGGVKIGGLKVRSLDNFIYQKKNARFVTLDEIRRDRFPKLKGRCIYMINKFFIMKDADLYKLDPAFIYRVNKVSSRDIEGLEKLPEFTIIRVFTATPHNRFPERFPE